MIADPQVVPIVGQEFLQAGPSHIGELDLGFLRRHSGFAPFQDVLFPGAGGLDHLIDSSIASGEILVGKAKGDVVDNFRFLEGKQRLIISARRQQTLRLRGMMGSLGTRRIMLPLLPIIPILLIRLFTIHSNPSH